MCFRFFKHTVLCRYSCGRRSGQSPDASQQGNTVIAPDSSTQSGSLPDSGTDNNSANGQTSASAYIPPPSNLTMPQRVSKLEHQMANQIDLMNQFKI